MHEEQTWKRRRCTERLHGSTTTRGYVSEFSSTNATGALHLLPLEVFPDPIWNVETALTVSIEEEINK